MGLGHKTMKHKYAWLFISLLMAMTTTIGASDCYLFDRGYGPEQWVGIEASNSSTVVTMGEVPTSAPGIVIGSYNNKLSSCIKDGTFNSNNCAKSVKLLDLLTGANTFYQNRVLVTSGVKLVIYTSVGVGFSTLPSGARCTFNTTQNMMNTLSNTTWVYFLFRNSIPYGNISTVLISDVFTGDSYIYGRPIAGLVKKDPSACEGFNYYVSVSRWTVYNNLRYLRYALVMAVALICTLIVYYHWHTNVVGERAFVSILSIVFMFAYSSTGFYFINFGEFAGIEFGYYVAMAIIYFTGFIRYAFKKYFQERSFRFYTEVYDTKVSKNAKLSSNDLNTAFRRNNRLNDLIANIPPEYIYCLILWVVILATVAPMAEMLYFDTTSAVAYPEQTTVATIVRFVFPVVAVLLPATAILIWTLKRFKEAEKGTGFFRVIRRFFSTYDDPLLYRFDFLMALALCFPLAILTFVVGYLDGLIPGWILYRRIISHSFHAFLYISFDVTFCLLVAGIYPTLLWAWKYHRQSFDFSDGETTYTNPEARKLSTSEQVMMFTIKDPKGRLLIEEFSQSSGNYSHYGVYRSMDALNIQLNGGATIDDALAFFFRLITNSKEGVGKEYNKIAIRYDLGRIESRSFDGKDKSVIIADVMEVALSYLISGVTIDGFFDTDEFKDFYRSKKDEIASYRALLKNAKKESNNHDQELEDFDPIAIYKDDPEAREAFDRMCEEGLGKTPTDDSSIGQDTGSLEIEVHE